MDKIELWNVIGKISQLIELAHLGGRFDTASVDTAAVFRRLCEVPYSVNLDYKAIDTICGVFFDGDPAWYKSDGKCVHITCSNGTPYSAPNATQCDVNPFEAGSAQAGGFSTDARLWFLIDGRWSQTIFERVPTSNALIIALCKNFIPSNQGRGGLIDSLNVFFEGRAELESRRHAEKVAEDNRIERELNTKICARLFDNESFKTWKKIVQPLMYGSEFHTISFRAETIVDEVYRRISLH